MHYKSKRKAKNSDDKRAINPLLIFVAIALLVVVFASMGMVAYLTFAIPSPAEQTATSVVSTNYTIPLIIDSRATQTQVTLNISQTREASQD